MTPEQQAMLWVFIGDKVWISLAAYVGVLVLAGARDITRQQVAKVRRERWRFFSLRAWYQLVSSTYRDTRGFFYIELFRFLSNLIICGVYVYSTYRRRVSEYIAIVNRLFGALFALDLILGSIFASSAVLYIFSYARFLQVFSLPSLFLAQGEYAFLHFGFLRAFSAYDSYIRMERRMVLLPFAPKKFAFRLFFQCLTLFYVLAAGIQMLEIPGDLLHASFVEFWFKEYKGWNFFNCIYYVIVTLSTVGYGDISPDTIQGRVYTIFMIIIGIIVFSNIIQEIVAETRRQRGDGSYSERVDTRHVIVSGTPTLVDLVHFVTEFYADSRHSNKDCVIVVLVERPKWTDMEWYRQVAHNHFLQNHIIYLVGELRNSGDLMRAGIHSADAIFILTSPASSGDPSNQDSQTVMSALAIRNVRTDIPIFSQTLLEDSNTQISVAMKTPRSQFYDPALIFREKMASTAMYRGIYEDTLRLERENLSVAFRHRESADTSGSDLSKEERKEGALALPGYKTDLERSSFVCLQQLYAALLAANIKANGVGTLCTNMYLDNPDNYHGGQQATWLQEYHLGAACSLLHAIIPKSLNGVRIDKIAALLFRRGIAIVATQKRGKLTLDTVLSPENELQAGELGLFLTYLDIKHLPSALHLVGHENATNTEFVLSRNFKAQKEKPEEEALAAAQRRKRARRQSTSNLPAYAAKFQTDRTSRGRKSHTFSRGMRLEDVKFGPTSQSFEFGGVARPEMDYYQSSEGAFDTSMNDIPGISPMMRSRSHIEFPDELSDHIIVAMEGQTPLENLPFFLKLLWHRDGRRAEIGRPNVQVVVIHPHITAECRELFRDCEGKSLFFVSGSPAASNSWKLAQLHTASAVATMADYTQDWQVSDARTVYTLLTLDAMTTSQQNLFICSELIHERSLEFLREPSHPRRRGARLGNPFLRHSQSTATFAPHTPGSDNEEDLLEDHDEIVKKENEAIGAANHGTVTAPPDEDYESEDFDSEFSSTVSEVPSVKEEECATNALFMSAKMNPGDMDSVKRPGASRAKRETLFARYRYTSGELLVHSTADTLLVREYAEPGFVKFITGLCGADSSSPGQKIRLVRIPKSLFREYKLINGQRLVEYGVVFERLIALGVTPLGLYRSGDAPARLPKSKRSKRGHTVMAEATMIHMPVPAKATKKKGPALRPIRAIVRQGQDVLPSSVLERRGQRELLGGGGSPVMSMPNWGKKNTKHEVSSTQSERRHEPVPTLESPDTSLNGGPPEPVQANAAATVLPVGLPVKRNSRLSDDHEYRPVHAVEGNLLPYVYTMPDINTLVADTDGVYILCDPRFELPRNWPRPPKRSE